MSDARTDEGSVAGLNLQELSDDEFAALVVAVRNERLRRRFEDQRQAAGKPDQRLAYVSWQDAVDALKSTHGDKAEYHVSRLWGVLDRETLMGALEIEGYCTHCARRIPRRSQEDGWTIRHQVGCPARSNYTSSTMLFSRRSLIQNLDKAPTERLASFPAWVVNDYKLVVEAVSREK